MNRLPRLPSTLIERFGPAFAALLVLGSALVFGLVGYNSEDDGAATVEDGSGAAAEPADSTTTTFVSGRVEAVSASELTLATENGSVVLALAPDASSEILAPTSPAMIRPGDWVNASMIGHEQTIFVLSGIVVIAEALADGTP